MSTKDVIKEVSTKWFDSLTEDDRRARYPASGKKIIQSIIKFSRKNLVLKRQIFPVGGGRPLGVWMLTPLGVERAMKGKGEWMPKFTNHDAIIIEEEK